jgi:hypothetical protein
MMSPDPFSPLPEPPAEEMAEAALPGDETTNAPPPKAKKKQSPKAKKKNSPKPGKKKSSKSGK